MLKHVLHGTWSNDCKGQVLPSERPTQHRPANCHCPFIGCSALRRHILLVRVLHLIKAELNSLFRLKHFTRANLALCYDHCHLLYGDYDPNKQQAYQSAPACGGQGPPNPETCDLRSGAFGLPPRQVNCQTIAHRPYLRHPTYDCSALCSQAPAAAVHVALSFTNWGM